LASACFDLGRRALTLGYLERVSDLDATFLSGETSSQHLHVLATLVLRNTGSGSQLDYEQFQRCVRERFHLVERLHQRLQTIPFSRPVWVDDSNLCLERHLHHVVLPRGSGLAELAAAASNVASFPLAMDRPLWEMWFVEGLEGGDAGVIVKIHHSAVDGVSGIWALAAFFDLEPNPQPLANTEWVPTRTSLATLGRNVLDGARKRPMTLAKSAARTVSAGLTLTRARGAQAPLPMSGPRLSYNRALTSKRSVALASIRIDDVKQVRHEVGASVNDVLVAVCAGVLRNYAISKNELPDRPLVAAVPVSERTSADGDAGNHLSFLFYALPVHVEDPIERLKFVTASAETVKEVYRRNGAGLLSSIACFASSKAVQPFIKAISSARLASVLPPAVNVLISSIKGPEMPLYLAGSEMTSLYPMGPIFEGVGLGITAVSYRDRVDFGFMACPDLIPDVERLAEDVKPEIRSMHDAVSNAFH
jgi:diacylglycerol O-acyltransferase / wax synthase